jgi:hypothetical protein
VSPAPGDTGRFDSTTCADLELAGEVELPVPSAAPTRLMLAVPQPYAALIAVGARAHWDFDRSDLPLHAVSTGSEVGIYGVPGWCFDGLEEDGLFRLDHPEREDELDRLRVRHGRQLALAWIKAVEQLDVRRYRITFDQVVSEAAA